MPKRFPRWFAYPKSRGFYIAAGVGGAPIADVPDQQNALMMAAAPAMLDALYDLAEFVEVALDAGQLLSVDGKRPEIMALKAARAAIATARGETAD
jgi:hypothetical protein